MLTEALKTLCKVANKKEKTPFYLIDLDQIKQNFLDFEHTWKKVFNRFRLAYSYKSNALKSITQQFLALKSSAEVVSETELEWALKDGFKSENIFFDGPLKTAENLILALNYGVNIQLDSIEELKQLIELFKIHKKSTKISIRLAANYQQSRKSRFGFTVDEAYQALNILDQAKLELNGLHIHLGSNLTDSSLFSSTLLEYKDILVKVLKDREKDVWLDIGGGFPAKSVSKENLPTPLNTFVNSIANTLEQYSIDINQIELIAEPGRCLVEDHGYLLTTIRNKKKRHNHHLLIVDAGIHLLRSINSWHHPLSILEGIESKIAGENVLYSIYGSNCFESDLFASQFQSSIELRIGDCVVIGSAGGYDICSANAWTRPLPPILGVLNKKIYLLRLAQTNDDVRKLQLDLENIQPLR